MVEGRFVCVAVAFCIVDIVGSTDVRSFEDGFVDNFFKEEIPVDLVAVIEALIDRVDVEIDEVDS